MSSCRSKRIARTRLHLSSPRCALAAACYVFRDRCTTATATRTACPCPRSLSFAPHRLPTMFVLTPLRTPRRLTDDARTRRKAYVIEKYIKPEELPSRLVEWEEPKPGEDEVLVDVHYAGLNCE